MLGGGFLATIAHLTGAHDVEAAEHRPQKRIPQKWEFLLEGSRKTHGDQPSDPGRFRRVASLMNPEWSAFRYGRMI